MPCLRVRFVQALLRHGNIGTPIGENSVSRDAVLLMRSGKAKTGKKGDKFDPKLERVRLCF